MKPLFICILAILAFGCFSQKKAAQIQVLNNPRLGDEAPIIRNRRNALRTPEIVKAYPVGRYIESDSGRVMHEKHTVYRVEGDAGWNLRGEEATREGGGANLGVPLSNAEITRGHLAALAEQNAMLETRLQVLEKERAQFLDLKQQNHKLQSELFQWKARLAFPPQENDEKGGKRVSFRMESFPIIKDPKPSL